MGKKKCNNQNETDVVLDSGQYMPFTVHMNKYGKEMSDAELGCVHTIELRKINE